MFIGKKVCVIESVPDAIRVCCVGGDLTYHVIPCPAGDEAASVKKLRSLVPAGRHRVIALAPRMACFMRMFHLPSQDPAELLGMVQFQFARTTPHKSADIVVDVKVLEQEPKSRSLVAGAMMAKDQLTPFTDMLDRAGIHPDVMTVNTQRLVPLAHVVWPEAIHGAGRVLGVYVSGGLLLGFFIKGEMVFSREEKFFGDKDSVLSAFLEYCAKEFPETSVKEIRLLGDREETGMSRTFSGIRIDVQELSLLVRTAQERLAFELSPVAYLDLLLAKDEKSKPFDLSIEKLKARRESMKVRSWGMHIGIIVVLLISGLILSGWSTACREIRASHALQAAVANDSARVKDLEQKSLLLATLETRLATPVTTGLLAELSKSLPLAAHLNRIDMNNGELNIQGEADGLESVRAFQAALGHSTVFHDVRLDSIDKRPTESAQVVMFRISMKAAK